MHRVTETGPRRSASTAAQGPNRASETPARVCRHSLPRRSIGPRRPPVHRDPTTPETPETPMQATQATPETPAPSPGASPTSTAPTAACANATFRAGSGRTATVCRATAASTRTVDLTAFARRTRRRAGAEGTWIRRATTVAPEATCAAGTAPTPSSSRAGAPTTEVGSFWRADRTVATDARPSRPKYSSRPALRCTCNRAMALYTVAIPYRLNGGTSA